MELPDEQTLAKLLNDTTNGWARAMDLAFVQASDSEVVVEWTVAEKHLQPHGIVHGGVHAGVIETVCSIGAALSARTRGQEGGVVGLENHTSFIRAVRAGARLRGRAVPVTRGRTTQVWEAQITDEAGRLIAQGTVRLLCITEGALPPPAAE